MYCPNCSNEASTEQKFCRSCGMELQAVAGLVSAQTNITIPDAQKGENFRRNQRTMLVWGMILMLGAAGVGASLKLLGREHIQVAGEFTPYLSVIMVLIAIFGMGLICYPFLLSSTAASAPKPALPKPGPTAEFNAGLLMDEPASVTEQTTNLLEVSESRINVRDTAPSGE